MEPKEPKNRLAEIFADLGIKDLRLADAQLGEWKMSPHRFNKLVQNRASKPMTLTEAESLKKWLQKNFKGANTYLFESDMPIELRNRQSKLNL
ncbi:hypothetical protein [uncultured Pontibacter sp.]|uniref:hypothetical protein n=1 Tax=uncultured Pontibacter sp. TaxID=453356 RepID=UPI00260555C4|nr:hypothetical protein [uncultured Pontibacter sp.]